MEAARHFAGDDGRRLNAGGCTVILHPCFGQLDAHADAGNAAATMSTSTEVSALS